MTMNKEAAAVIAKMRDRKVNHGKHTSPTLIEWADELESALSAIAEPAPYGMTPVHDGMPRAGEIVIVYQPDRGDGDRYDFDYIEDGGWAIHNERHEFFLSVGGAGAAGPDMTCVGPSEIAPYTHWSSLPKPEAGQSAAKQPAPPASAEPVAGRDDEIRDLILQYGNARAADNGRGSWQEQKGARDASVSAYSKILDHLELRATPPASCNPTTQPPTAVPDGAVDVRRPNCTSTEGVLVYFDSAEAADRYFSDLDGVLSQPAVASAPSSLQGFGPMPSADLSGLTIRPTTPEPRT